MKNILKILLTTTVVALSVASCELDKFPFSGIEQSQSFLTIKDAEAHRNGLYNNLRARIYGIYTFSMDVQTNWLNATLDYGNRNGFPHKWTEFLSTDYTIRDVWQGYYASLANVNNLITNLPTIVTTTPADSAKLSRFIGEAHFLRAFYYHQLVQRWAKDYEPATAATDPGVPLVLTYDINLMPARASVADVYAQILTDLGVAKTRLEATPGAPNSSRITKDAVTALEARVYLCMHNWTAAVTAANALISSPTYTMVTTETAFKNMWQTDASTEDIFRLFSSIAEGANTNSIYLGWSQANLVYTPDFVPTQSIVDLYDAADFRRAAYFIQGTVRVQGFDYPNTWVFNKYRGNPALYSGTQTNYHQQPKVFRMGEMYLISAEAAAMTPATEGAALATLNVLRSKRGLTDLVGLTGTALRDAIRLERTKELLGDGTSLDDYKRWNLGFTRGTPQNTAFLNLGVDFHLKTVLAGDDKFVWGIPSRDVTVNPNLTDRKSVV